MGVGGALAYSSRSLFRVARVGARLDPQSVGPGGRHAARYVVS